MRIENKQISIVYADEGKVLRNKRTGAIVGDSVTGYNLGYNYYEVGVGLRVPYLVKPTDLEDIEGSLENPPKTDESFRLSRITELLNREKQEFKTLGLTSEQMLTHKAFAPKWGEDIKEGDSVVKGDKFTYNGRLYAVLQDHTILAHYEPSINTAALYVEVTPDYTEEGEELGTLENPIPYEGNMILENGEYYSQGGVTYLCTRDSINPIYHPLSALVGQYVEEV